MKSNYYYYKSMNIKINKKAKIDMNADVDLKWKKHTFNKILVITKHLKFIKQNFKKATCKTDIALEQNSRKSKKDINEK